MLKRLTSVDEHMEFVNRINADADFREPMLSDEEEIQCNLLDAPKKPSNQIFGIFDKEEMIGLFVFLVLEEESYIEMLVGLSAVESAYIEMLDYLKGNFTGYQVDFVYNPGNYHLHNILQNEGAQFDIEQQKMVLKKDIPFESDHKIELYSPKYKEQYVDIHLTDRYWTADKVIDAPELFRIILAIENEEVVGYLDITHKYEENEPYDLFVKEEHRKKGYGKALLAKAIELNKPKDMMLLVDIDNTVAISLYESLGFEKTVGENNITAYLQL